MTTQLLFIQCLSPLHAGTGQSTGAIDLTVARDVVTGYPLLPGSSLKGSLRARSQQLSPNTTTHVFGPESTNASEHAGALTVGDANLLLFPARSVKGTFAFLTSPHQLRNFQRDAELAGIAGSQKWSVPTVTQAACLVAGDTLLVGNKVILEELDLQASEAVAKEWAEHLTSTISGLSDHDKKSISERLCIVDDDTLSFMTQYAMDVATRISLEDETKTVKKGQLWTEENLPTESILISTLSATASRKPRQNGDADQDENAILAHVRALTQQPLSLGGNTTVGRGRSAFYLTGQNENGATR